MRGYAQAIMAAGGLCEFHVWGGAFHGFYDIVPQTGVAQASIVARNALLRRVFAAA